VRTCKTAEDRMLSTAYALHYTMSCPMPTGQFSVQTLQAVQTV